MSSPPPPPERSEPWNGPPGAPPNSPGPWDGPTGAPPNSPGPWDRPPGAPLNRPQSPPGQSPLPHPPRPEQPGSGHPAPEPLLDLPAPQELPLDAPGTAEPDQIMVGSRRTVFRRLLASSWRPGLVLLVLWYLLLLCYVIGAAPTFWSLGLLVALVEPNYFVSMIRSLGFTPGGLALSFMFLPLGATLASLATLPLSTHLVASMNPRMHLTEADFQRAVSVRAALPMMLLPLATVAILVIVVLTPAQLQWNTLGAGPLSGLSAGLVWCLLAWVLLRRLLSAPRVLGITSAPEQMLTWQTSRRTMDPERRSRLLASLVAQDRRHLPPTPTPATPTPAAMARMAARSLAVTSRAVLVWVAPVILGIGWLLFSIADFAVVISRLDATLTGNVLQTGLGWQVYTFGIPLLLVLAAVIAVAPLVAMRLARPERANVTDQRTYPEWAKRARVNPWEARVVTLTGVIDGAAAVAVTVALTVLLQLTGGMSALTWTWLVIDALAIGPLIGLAGARAMRRDLRYVVYGPAGLYTRRKTPYVLVAPEVGADPAAHAGASSASIPEEVYPQADAEQIKRGVLPDFGAGRPGEPAPGREDPHEIAGREDPHEIPGSDTGLRRR